LNPCAFSAFGYDDLQRRWVSELGHPWDQVELYRKLSPIYDVKRVETPTLVMCGDIRPRWGPAVAGSSQTELIRPGSPPRVFQRGVEVVSRLEPAPTR
jgi:hypothetical protein